MAKKNGIHASIEGTGNTVETFAVLVSGHGKLPNFGDLGSAPVTIATFATRDAACSFAEAVHFCLWSCTYEGTVQVALVTDVYPLSDGEPFSHSREVSFEEPDMPQKGPETKPPHP